MDSKTKRSRGRPKKLIIGTKVATTVPPSVDQALMQVAEIRGLSKPDVILEFIVAGLRNKAVAPVTVVDNLKILERKIDVLCDMLEVATRLTVLAESEVNLPENLIVELRAEIASLKSSINAADIVATMPNNY